MGTDLFWRKLEKKDREYLTETGSCWQSNQTRRLTKCRFYIGSWSGSKAHPAIYEKTCPEICTIQAKQIQAFSNNS